jgi:hypothetical protein
VYSLLQREFEATGQSGVSGGLEKYILELSFFALNNRK